MDHVEVNKLWKIRKTLFQLCHDRGYLVTQDELDETEDEFIAELVEEGGLNNLRENMCTTVVHNDDINEQMIIFFPVAPTIGLKHLYEMTTRMQEANIERAIMVVQKALTPSAKKAAAAQSPTFIIECFQEQELLVNITEHELVPDHIVLTAQEKSQVLEKYMAKDQQLPRLMTIDPVARYYGLKRGQVVKIVRESKTAGRYVAYRLVQ